MKGGDKERAGCNTGVHRHWCCKVQCHGRSSTRHSCRRNVCRCERSGGLCAAVGSGAARGGMCRQCWVQGVRG